MTFCKNIFVVSILLSLLSCGEDVKEAPNEPLNTDFITLESPQTQKIKSGEEIQVNIKLADGAQPDSSFIFVNGKEVFKGKTPPKSYIIITKDKPVGRYYIKLKAYVSGNYYKAKKYFTVVSDITPATWNYEIVKTYNHNPENYTQGLEYSDNEFYESTGRRGKSKVLLLDLNEGFVLKEEKLKDEFFGEGITRMGEKLYHISWQSGKGWIRDAWNLKEQALINFKSSNGEGWGLTNNGEKIILSDGSENLNFMDPENFVHKYTIEVYDDKGPVTELNELEYYDGLVYANIFQDNSKIAVIDPNNGKVIAYIKDFSKLKEENNEFSTERHENVLNGIAIHPKTKNLLITGKLWGKMYEIKLVKPE